MTSDILVILVNLTLLEVPYLILRIVLMSAYGKLAQAAETDNYLDNIYYISSFVVHSDAINPQLDFTRRQLYFSFSKML